jgi:hypothetical protein
MDEQTAKLIIAAGFAVGVVFWLIGLHLYRKMADAPRIERLEARLSGKTPAEAIKSIIDGVLPSGGMARLTRPNEHALHISQVGVEIDVTAQHAGGQTLVAAEIDDAKLVRKLQIPLAILVTLVMPVVIVGVPAALWYLVAPSPTPAIRWQSVQVLQIVHVLWPPFLLYFLWKKQREMVVSTVSNLLVRAEAS